jgi:2-amino-4-hydroxy-6-hydroxymethyldihydropteridine diphosphokinase
LQEIEQRHGRQRTVRHGPRTLDLDLLLYDDRVIDEPDLQVPHPRMWQRTFVTGPLAEICAVERLARYRRLGST